MIIKLLNSNFYNRSLPILMSLHGHLRRLDWTQVVEVDLLLELVDAGHVRVLVLVQLRHDLHFHVFLGRVDEKHVAFGAELALVLRLDSIVPEIAHRSRP